MALGEAQRLMAGMHAAIDGLRVKLPALLEDMKSVSSSLELSATEAEAFATMSENLFAQLNSGAASVEQAMRDFKVRMDATYIPGYENLLSELNKTLGAIQQNSQAIAALAVDFATGKKGIDDVLAAIESGSPVVAKAVEDALKLSRSAEEALARLEELRVNFANKNKGGSPLDAVLQQLQQNLLSGGDLSKVVGSGLNGGRL